jgi:hypothetical protein
MPGCWIDARVVPQGNGGATAGSNAMNGGREHALESMMVGQDGCLIGSRAFNACEPPQRGPLQTQLGRYILATNVRERFENIPCKVYDRYSIQLTVGNYARYILGYDPTNLVALPRHHHGDLVEDDR